MNQLQLIDFNLKREQKCEIIRHKINENMTCSIYVVYMPSTARYYAVFYERVIYQLSFRPITLYACKLAKRKKILFEMCV